MLASSVLLEWANALQERQANSCWGTVITTAKKGPGQFHHPPPTHPTHASQRIQYATWWQHHFGQKCPRFGPSHRDRQEHWNIHLPRIVERISFSLPHGYHIYVSVSVYISHTPAWTWPLLRRWRRCVNKGTLCLERKSYLDRSPLPPISNPCSSSFLVSPHLSILPSLPLILLQMPKIITFCPHPSNCLGIQLIQ